MARGKNIVKSTKSSISLSVIALIGVGWLLVLSGTTRDKTKEAQDALVKEAQGYVEDRLYVRAAASYKEALSYKTAEINNIEKQLVDTYRAGDMMEECYTLVRKRIIKGTATEEEIIDLGTTSLADGDYLTVVRYLSQACETYPDNKEIRDIFESARYIHNESTTLFDTVKMPSEGFVPAFNGQKWGYLSTGGKQILDFQYDEVSEFSEGYAVVKLDGNYIVINESGQWYSIDKDGVSEVKQICGSMLVAVKDGKCAIYSREFERLSKEDYEDVILNDNGRSFVKVGGKWKLISKRFTEISKTEYSDVVVNERGKAFGAKCAVVADARGYYLIKEDGTECFEKRFQQAKGCEEGYVAVSNDSGKWGFINEKGDMILEYQYDDAYSFSSCLAAVRKGNEWSYINEYGQTMIDDDYQGAFPFWNEFATVINRDGNVAVLKLRYYDYIKRDE